jgi:hypothetical protein
MTFHLFCLMLSLARLCRLTWCHHCPAQLRAAARHPIVQRLLKPHSPHDCPACRLSSTFSSLVGPAPLSVRPWREVKSRRGAPKRMNTQGFACPNQQCQYSGITDAHIHALLWGWYIWPGFANPDVSPSGLPHHVQCSTPHSFVPPETALPCRVAVVLTAQACGLDPSTAERVFGYRQATITSLSDSRS